MDFSNLDQAQQSRLRTALLQCIRQQDRQRHAVMKDQPLEVIAGEAMHLGIDVQGEIHGTAEMDPGMVDRIAWNHLNNTGLRKGSMTAHSSPSSVNLRDAQGQVPGGVNEEYKDSIPPEILAQVQAAEAEAANRRGPKMR